MLRHRLRSLPTLPSDRVCGGRKTTVSQVELELELELVQAESQSQQNQRYMSVVLDRRKGKIAMSKNEKIAPATIQQVQRSFYRPHDRVLALTTVRDVKTGKIVTPPSRTKQSHKDECDINNIIKQFKVTGMFNHVRNNAAQGVYTDLPEPVEFQEALNIVMGAENAFAMLPAKIRDEFGNDPQRFLAFTADPRNADRMAELGLTNPVAPPTMVTATLEEAAKAFVGAGAGGDTPPADASPKAPKGA